MKRSTAEQIPEMHLCPFCEFVDGDWENVIDHMVKNHTDSDAKDLGYGVK